MRADYCVHETILKLVPWALVACVNRSDLQISRHGFRMHVFKPEQQQKDASNTAQHIKASATQAGDPQKPQKVEERKNSTEMASGLHTCVTECMPPHTHTMQVHTHNNKL